LRRHFQLGGGAGSSLGAVLEALACQEVCQELGLAEANTLQDLRDRLLSRRIGSDDQLSFEDLKKKGPRVLLGAKRGGVAGLRDAVLLGWADADTTPAPAGSTPRTHPAEPGGGVPEEAEFDLDAFARTVKAAARDCRTGWFGGNKVFISHVWRHLRDEPGFPPLDLPTFKQRLVEANNARLLTLSRADLVQVMDPIDVQESETAYLNATFHFVLVEGEQP
jgi:hypothetical protein